MAWMNALAFLFVEKLQLLDRMQGVKLLLQPRMLALYGDNRSLFHSKRFVAHVLLVWLASLFVLLFVFAASGSDWTMFTVGLLFSLCIPPALYLELDRKIKRKKQSILIELPELLSRLTLLLNAGETIQGALMKCAILQKGANRISPETGSPLQRELARIAAGLQNREPFHLLMEQLSRRCAVQEISVFTTTVLMNYRRGGDSFVLALKALSHEMWERRKALTRTLGEEASSKLIFPMLLIFLVVMAIVATPAVMLMNQP